MKGLFYSIPNMSKNGKYLLGLMWFTSKANFIFKDVWNMINLHCIVSISSGC